MRSVVLLGSLFLALALTGCESADVGETPPSDAIGSTDVVADTTNEVVALHGCLVSGCDDGLSCTIDVCDETTGACSWDVLPQRCVIGGVCWSDDDPHPHDPCRVCSSAAASLAWTAIEGPQCDEEPLPPPVEGSCDDGDPCTEDDQLVDGGCVGSPLSCPDDGPCLQGACDPLSDGLCVLVPIDGDCDDGDPCTGGGACVEGACATGPELDCDDGNPCTIDHCDAIAGCLSLPTQNPCCVGTESICNDGNPCTDDLCDPATAACDYVPNTAPCQDGFVCTTDDVCSAGVCKGVEVNCEDGNPCTDNYCLPVEGCIVAELDGTACDDGLECSVGDACVAGACEADTSGCACTLEEEMDAAKINALALGLGGHSGEGVDVDGDPSTCAPASDCSGGVDNALGIISTFANEAVQSAVDSGDVILLLSFDGAQSGAFELGVYQATQNGFDCDIQTQPCAYLLDPSSVDSGSCTPMIALDAVLDGTTLTAGGPGTLFPFQLPLSDGVSLDVTIHDARVQGTVVLDDTGVIGLEGVVGGAIPKEALDAAIDALPNEGLPVDKALIQAVMGAVETDIDTTGDGVGDGCSVGFKISGIDAFVLGFGD